MGRRTLLVLALATLCLGCSDRARRNPLDPLAGDDVVESGSPLRAVAANGSVTVSWDYSYFTDITGYQLYRRQAADAYVRHPDQILLPETTSYTDRAVTNGQGYEYRLGLLIEGEGERTLPATVAATPGTEVVWVADRLSGLVWQVAPDGRNTAGAQGRFRSLEGMDIDPADGACWVTDRYVQGVYRLALDGSIHLFAMDIDEPGCLRLDGAGRRGWVIDRGRAQVLWFDIAAPTETLRCSAADAHFADPVGLAPQDGGCWIGDGEARRVLYVHPDGQRVEYADLPGIRALASGGAGSVWALIDAGHRLVRLSRTGRGAFLDLPFAVADVVADTLHGRIWVIGAGSVALLAENGAVQQQWDGPLSGKSLGLDLRHQAVWVAGQNELWKLTAEGEQLSLLRGFSGLLRVAVAPAGGVPASLDRVR
jgi:hypothetical protein